MSYPHFGFIGRSIDRAIYVASESVDCFGSEDIRKDYGITKIRYDFYHFTERGSKPGSLLGLILFFTQSFPEVEVSQVSYSDHALWQGIFVLKIIGAADNTAGNVD